MSTLTIPNTFQNGATIVAAEHNANFTAVKSFVEALSAGTNIDNGAIQSAALADSSVVTGRIATYAVTGVKIEPSVALTGTTTAAAISVTGNVVYHIATNNAAVTNYTLVLTDDGKIVEMNPAVPTTVTVPLNSSVAFPIGTRIEVLQTGTGQCTITPAVGVTINSTPGLKTRALWSLVVLTKRATNTWLLSGDTAA
jgi:hypothetical protein